MRKKTGKNIICPVCKIEFYLRISELNRGETHTCSKKCMGILKYGQKRPLEVGLHISQAKKGVPQTDKHKKSLHDAIRKPPTKEAIKNRTYGIRKYYQDPIVRANLPNSKVEYTCKQCGKKFFRYKNISIKYCSVECRGIANQKRTIRLCLYCGKEYTVVLSKEKNKYCSVKCYNASHITLKKCLYCNKEFSIQYFKINGGSGKYCSRICFHKANSGKNSSLYVHGNWVAPYCHKFNEKLKEEIRNNFDRRCFICGIHENGKKLDVHHVDYNKGQGCGQKWNLVPLCNSCHAKTTHKRKRHYYFNLLSNYWAMNININFRGDTYFI